MKISDEKLTIQGELLKQQYIDQSDAIALNNCGSFQKIFPLEKGSPNITDLNDEENKR